MALFRRKPKPREEPPDHRSKRGGARRSTEQVEIDISALEKRAAPAPGTVPTPRVGGRPRTPAAGTASAKASTRRISGPAATQSARRSGRTSGRGRPIGELLVDAGAIKTEQLTKALKTQEKGGGLLGQILVKMGACERTDVAAALAKQIRVTPVDLPTITPEPVSLLMIPPDKCRDFKLIPFECVGQYICVAMVNVLNRKAVNQVEALSKLKVKGFKTGWPDISAAIDRYYTPEIIQGVEQINQARVREGVVPYEYAKKMLDKAAGAPAKAGKRAKTLSKVDEKTFTLVAEQLAAQGRIEDGIRKLEAGLAALPGSRNLPAAIAKLRRRAEAEQAKAAERHLRVAEILAQARAERDAGNLDNAQEKFREASKLDPNNNVIKRELSHTERERARLRSGAAAREDAGGVSRAAMGGERRIEAGQIDHENLIALEETPAELHPGLGEAVASRMGLASPDEGLSRLPVAPIYAKSLDALRKMVEAAAAALDEALGEEVLVPTEGEAGLELEPGIEPQPPMPGVEEQLEAEAEMLPALEAEEVGEEEFADLEVVEAIAERAPATPVSDAEFEELRADLEPDPVQRWRETFAAAGPVPAVPAGH